MKSKHNAKQLTLESLNRLLKENQVMRAQLQAERGAEICLSAVSSPVMENEFLKLMMSIVEEADKGMVRVFDYIGRPAFPINYALLNESQCSKEVERLMNIFDEHSIDIMFPETLPWSEMLRFIVEDMFTDRMDNIRLEGLRCLFFYDMYNP